MTKQEFLNIVDSGDKARMTKHSSDPDFIKFAKEIREEFKATRKKETERIQESQDVKNSAISSLIQSNKDIIPKVNTLVVPQKNDEQKEDDREFYNEVLEDFYNEYESVKGNVLVCAYDDRDSRLLVYGMYKDVEVRNFGGEHIFVIDGDRLFFGFGTESYPIGAKNLETFLSCLDVDLDSMKIDENLFNTGADYFILN